MIGLLFLIVAVVNVVLFVVVFFNQRTINIWRTRATTGRGVQ